MGAIVDFGGGVMLERAVPCRMSDGITLYADHYSPAFGPSMRPTLLMRQPYGRDIASTVVYAHPAWFARQGYNVVIQDVRGRGDSEGDFYPFRHEGRDGAETIAALRSRPECDGSVGMYGFSYQGMTQLLAAAEQPEGLRCISPAMTVHDLYHGWFYHHGALRLASTLGWGLQMLRADTRRLGLREASDTMEAAWRQLSAQYLSTPYADNPALTGEGVPTYVCDWLEHTMPGDYWTSMDVSQTIANIRIPALHVSGWYDTYLKGSVDGFLAMSAHARDNQYLVAGPWVHIPWGDRAGGCQLGERAVLDTDVLLLRWFDHWLKGKNAFASEPRIRHYALGAGTWHHADSFAAPDYCLYLQSDGRANSSKGDGRLRPERPTTAEPPDVYVYDPEVPVLAPGGAASIAGPLDQAQLELGNHLLTYTTEPLLAPLHVFGSAQVEFHVATSSAHADLVVKLVCVRPSGESIFVCVGVARRAFLFPEEYRVDTVHIWSFPLEATSCIFAVGDRLRIEVASSAYPLYDRNPGSSVEPRFADSWNWERSTQLVFHDDTRPSAIYLPVIPADAA